MLVAFHESELSGGIKLNSANFAARQVEASGEKRREREEQQYGNDAEMVREQI